VRFSPRRLVDGDHGLSQAAAAVVMVVFWPISIPWLVIERRLDSRRTAAEIPRAQIVDQNRPR
jgi:hypothetical protein